MGTKAKVMSLWNVIEAMQRRLEREGLDATVVDAAVTRGIERLVLEQRARQQSPGLSFLSPCAVAKA
jgi:hypothetical protein